MQKNMKNALRLSILGSAIAFAASAAAADDWSLPGANCVASLGVGGPDGSHGFINTSSSASVVADCPMVKKLGADNVNYAYARVERTGGNSSSFINCALLASDTFGDGIDATWSQASSGTGGKTVSLPVPSSVQSNRYISDM